MKYRPEIESALSVLHEDWIDDEDKRQFNDELIRKHFQNADQAIEVGIANGYSVEQQMKIMTDAFLAEK